MSKETIRCLACTSDDIKFAYKGSTSTKEECYEAALQYVLNNLI